MSRAEQLIRELRLQPHPEGGWYAEVFRSALTVQPADGRGARGGLTTIYFLLTRGQQSRLHRVMSDEVWHFYEGDPLQLTVCDAAFDALRDITLSEYDGIAAPVHVVAAGHWQAARTLGDYSLVGCSVGPAFDFADFTMLKDVPDLSARFHARHAGRSSLV